MGKVPAMPYRHLTLRAMQLNTLALQPRTLPTRAKNETQTHNNDYYQWSLKQIFKNGAVWNKVDDKET